MILLQPCLTLIYMPVDDDQILDVVSVPKPCHVNIPRGHHCWAIRLVYNL